MSKTLITEIKNVSLITLVLAAVQILITVPAGYFGSAAVFGTLLGSAVAIINFAFMGLILEKTLSSQKTASGFMGIGYILRLVFIGAAVIWAMKVSYLNYVCVIIPLVFPQISIFIINAVRRRKGQSDDERT